MQGVSDGSKYSADFGSERCSSLAAGRIERPRSVANTFVSTCKLLLSSITAVNNRERRDA